MSVITYSNFGNEPIYPGKYWLIFSKELLKQNNYHFNLQDTNGMINETHTYFPWNISHGLNKIGVSGGDTANEIVFHDEINMKYCCEVIETRGENSRTDNWERISKKEAVNSYKADITTLPFYCFVNEDVYNGAPTPTPSSFTWYKMIARMTGLNTMYLSKQEIISEIRKKAAYLYSHRDKQHLLEIMEYTTSYSQK